MVPSHLDSQKPWVGSNEQQWLRCGAALGWSSQGWTVGQAEVILLPIWPASHGELGWPGLGWRAGFSGTGGQVEIWQRPLVGPTEVLALLLNLPAARSDSQSKHPVPL